MILCLPFLLFVSSCKLPISTLDMYKALYVTTTIMGVRVTPLSALHVEAAIFVTLFFSICYAWLGGWILVERIECPGKSPPSPLDRFPNRALEFNLNDEKQQCSK